MPLPDKPPGKTIADRVNEFMATQPIGKYVRLAELADGTGVGVGALAARLFGLPLVHRQSDAFTEDICIGVRRGVKGLVRVRLA